MAVPEPLPRIAAFEKLGFGMFIHFGLYSQLGSAEWVQSNRRIPPAEYQKLKDAFTAKDFDAEALARLAKSAGMRYIVLTTRHHEGFSLYDTCGLNEFDAPHSPAKRDLVREFVDTCRKYDIVPFFYHTTLDWFWRNKKTNELELDEFNEYLDYLRDSVEILCRNYGKVGGFWFDGNWSRRDADWKLDRLYGTIRKHQPEAIIVDNTGVHRPGEVGHPEVDAVTFENQAARPLKRDGFAKYAAAEVCQPMNCHWGVAKNDFNFKSPAEIIELLCHSRGCGANLLLDIGPEAQGGIPAYERSVLEIVGRWISIYGESVYDTKTVSEVKCQGRDVLLQNGNTFYYFVFGLGIHGNANVTVNIAGIGSRAVDGFSRKIVSARWMDNGEEIQISQNLEAGMATFRCTGYPFGSHTVVRVIKIETV